MGPILYFDCFSGAAGDMVLGALVDAGLPFEALRAALGSLALEGGEVTADRVSRAGIAAIKFRVGGEPLPDEAPAGVPAHAHADEAHPGRLPRSHGASRDRGLHRTHSHHQPPRGLGEVLAIVERSALSPAARGRAVEMVRRLAEVEAEIHQIPVERVHLHEVGAVDSIIDIVGAAFAFDWFGANQVIVSPINVGGGTARTAHGIIPVPAPATVRLLGDAPIYGGTVQKELLTPTGALVLTTYATAFGPIPRMRVSSVGYGAGDHDLAGTPNVLRVIVGEADDQAPSMRVVVIECEIDDMNPQIFGVLMDRLQAAGALEVFYSAVQMKKGRPGTLVTVIAPPERRPALTELLFRESTTIGVRYSVVDRECLSREVQDVDTPLGTVRFKVARRQGAVLNAAPEFDDCARIAAERGVPVKEVQAVAVKAYLDASRR